MDVRVREGVLYRRTLLGVAVVDLLGVIFIACAAIVVASMLLRRARREDQLSAIHSRMVITPPTSPPSFSSPFPGQDWPTGRSSTSARPSSVTRFVSDRPTGQFSELRDEIIEGWDMVSRTVPEPARSFSYLSRTTGVDYDSIAHARDVRVACAHPSARGWPSSSDIQAAATTVRALRFRMRV